jgi:hypothetical protein
VLQNGGIGGEAGVETGGDAVSLDAAIARIQLRSA